MNVFCETTKALDRRPGRGSLGAMKVEFPTSTMTKLGAKSMQVVRVSELELDNVCDTSREYVARAFPISCQATGWLGPSSILSLRVRGAPVHKSAVPKQVSLG